MKVTRREASALGLAALMAPQPAETSVRLITGVNLAGLEFNSARLPGRVDHDFAAPSADDLNYYADHGARAVRLPFLWERLHPNLDGDFDEGHWRLIATVLSAAQTLSMRVILDPHQYGRRRLNGAAHVIGESAHVTDAHFASFWRALAERCAAWPETVFGLQNEPHGQNRDILVRVQNSAIAAIREVGARNLILASGSAWSGAHSWISSGNAEMVRAIHDPGANVGFDVHQYLDADSSGAHANCVGGAGSRLDRFTQWARSQGQRGFLGEFGAGGDALCLSELERLLQHMADNRDVWIGWTCWGGGPWWPDDYPLSLQPPSAHRNQTRPQLGVLQRYFE